MVNIYKPTFPQAAVHFDPEAFDLLVRQHGVKYIHYRSMRCPIGLTDMNDSRQPHATNGVCKLCSNGFIYERVGEVTCTFMGNNKQSQQQEIGSVDASGVQISFPRFYDDDSTKIVSVVPFDRLYLVDEAITVPNWQLHEHNVSGIDKLRFPVVAVESLIDSSGKRYYEGTDFIIENGLIVWQKNRPQYNIELSKGDVYVVRYTYRPYYYISKLNHEIRIANTVDPLTGATVSYRMGQSCSIQREYFFENAQNDVDSPSTDLRASRIPDVDFGAR